MAARIGQVDAVSGAPSYVGRALRQLSSVFLGAATPARPLGAQSGVRPGTPSSIVTATSTTWTVTPFAGVIDLHTAAIAGPYEFAFDANVTGAVTAASGSIARVDILYVRASDPSESDGSSVPAIEVLYLAGTVASTPPATPARSFVLAQINVPISGGGSPTVTWVAPYCVGSGGILPVPAGTYPAASYAGQYVDDPAQGLLRSNGTAWRRGYRSKFGEYSKVAAPGHVLASPAYADTPVTLTATSLGGLVEIEFDASIAYAGVGINNLVIYYRVLCDGVAVGDESTQYLYPIAAGSVARLSVAHTPSAGAHTWKVQMASSSVTAAVLGKARLIVIENP